MITYIVNKTFRNIKYVANSCISGMEADTFLGLLSLNFSLFLLFDS